MTERDETEPDCPNCGSPATYKLFEQVSVCRHADGRHRTAEATDVDETICLDSPTGEYRCHYEGGCGTDFSAPWTAVSSDE